MRVTTWNVNSIRRRLDAVLGWVERHRPDVVCLQETKCTEDLFPWIGFRGLGYEVAAAGQKGYNGVAIASLSPPSDIVRAPVWERDPDARSMAATIGGLRIVNVYVPYGQAVGTGRFRSKLRWMARLESLLATSTPDLVSGDFNVAPDDRDVYDPRIRRGKLIASPAEREAFRRLVDAGYLDAFRAVSEEGGHFTWWSHRVGAVERNRGLRVDHHLVRKDHGGRILSVQIDVEERRRTGASDHAPVTLVLE